MSTTDWLRDADCMCRHCGKTKCVEYRLVEDDEGHEDVNYRCIMCSRTWWIDGIDS